MMDSGSEPWRRVARLILGLFLCAGGMLLLIYGVNGLEPASRPHGERKERSSGRNFAAETDVRINPGPSASAPGWDSERVWSGQDDWEPFVAADPSSPYVYQMTTRFNTKLSGIFIRRSPDGGATWLADNLIAPVNVWQADPQVQVADDGTVFVVWLDGPNWKIRLAKSFDYGATWTEPVVVAHSLRWTDHPWLLVSGDGQDVYVGLNMDDSFVASSHDGGQAFGAPFKTNRSRPGHWWDANGAAIAPDGTPYFVVIDFLLDYRGPAEVTLVSSHDRGATWQTAVVATSAPPLGCGGAAGCEYGFLSTTSGLAVDRNGKFLLAYHASAVARDPQPMWVITSDDGLTWTSPVRISQPNDKASSGFPAVAAGPRAGDFRVVWQGNGDGDPRRWNTYYRRTVDGGASWGPVARLSDRASGAPYKHPGGYTFPYGDYIGLSVDGAGRNHAIWGEGDSYDGPGGVWYSRGGP